MRTWLGVACRIHVERGVAGGFAQLCHGKQAALRRMQAGDWLVYYSPTVAMRGGERLQAFTALGQVADDRIHRHDMGGGFIPYRRKVRFQTVREVPLADLRGRLHLTARAGWGVALRRGHLELETGDFQVIATAMGHPPSWHPPPAPDWTAGPLDWWFA
jgi:hypothetical protein